MNIAIIVFYVVIIGAMMYFMAIKPQKKEQKRQQELMDSMEIGDYVSPSEKRAEENSGDDRRDGSR